MLTEGLSSTRACCCSSQLPNGSQHSWRWQGVAAEADSQPVSTQLQSLSHGLVVHCLPALAMHCGAAGIEQGLQLRGLAALQGECDLFLCGAVEWGIEGCLSVRVGLLGMRCIKTTSVCCTGHAVDTSFCTRLQRCFRDTLRVQGAGVRATLLFILANSTATCLWRMQPLKTLTQCGWLLWSLKYSTSGFDRRTTPEVTADSNCLRIVCVRDSIFSCEMFSVVV